MSKGTTISFGSEEIPVTGVSITVEYDPGPPITEKLPLIMDYVQKSYDELKGEEGIDQKIKIEYDNVIHTYQGKIMNVVRVGDEIQFSIHSTASEFEIMNDEVIHALIVDENENAQALCGSHDGGKCTANINLITCINCLDKLEHKRKGKDNKKGGT